MAEAHERITSRFTAGILDQIIAAVPIGESNAATKMQIGKIYGIGAECSCGTKLRQAVENGSIKASPGSIGESCNSRQFREPFIWCESFELRSSPDRPTLARYRGNEIQHDELNSVPSRDMRHGTNFAPGSSLGFL